jgi:hypothetical protein
MKSTEGIARWLTKSSMPCAESSGNRARTFRYECEIPAATNINVSLLF